MKTSERVIAIPVPQSLQSEVMLGTSITGLGDLLQGESMAAVYDAVRHWGTGRVFLSGFVCLFSKATYYGVCVPLIWMYKRMTFTSLERRRLWGDVKAPSSP